MIIVVEELSINSCVHEQGNTRSYVFLTDHQQTVDVIAASELITKTVNTTYIAMKGRASS